MRHPVYRLSLSFMCTALGALLLAGCGPSGGDAGAGGVTAREAQALNEAAEMLDSRPSAVDGVVGNAAPANP